MRHDEPTGPPCAWTGRLARADDNGSGHCRHAAVVVIELPSGESASLCAKHGMVLLRRLARRRRAMEHETPVRVLCEWDGPLEPADDDGRGTCRHAADVVLLVGGDGAQVCRVHARPLLDRLLERAG